MSKSCHFIPVTVAYVLWQQNFTGLLILPVQFINR